MARRVLAFAFTIIILLSTTIVVAEDGKKYHTHIPDGNHGDYLSYSVDISAWTQSIIDDSEGDDFSVIEVIVNENSPMNKTYTEQPCFEIEGDICEGVVDSWTTNFTLILEPGSDYADDKIVQLLVMEGRGEKANGTTWYETTMSMEMWYVYDGNPYHIETIDTEVEEKQILEESPEQVSVGDSWITRSESEVTITSQFRYNGGDWDVEITEESWTNTTNFVAESSGNIFTNGEPIDTLRIKTQEVGHSDYEINHVTELGVGVKRELYDEEGALLTIATLTDYFGMELENEPVIINDSEEEAGSLPGFGMFATILAIGMMALTRRELQ